MLLALAGLLATTIAVPVHAQSQDLQNGLALARRVCSECHAVQRMEQRSPNARAPTFEQLAATPGMTQTALTVALTTPHAGMPMFRLIPEQRADIVAYILSLR
jgi:mono/diheme cytochrome c family protein